jgi:prepilin-type N-terminal cleavage/methylation domain-containing protein
MIRHAGFSMLELMVSLAILGLIVVGVFQSFGVQHKTYVVVDQVTEAQQNLRAVTDIIERDVRLAGYMAPRGAAVCGVDQTTAADTLYVSDADVIGSVSALEAADPDLLSGELGVPVSNAFSAWGWSAGSGDDVTVNLPRLWVDVSGAADFAVEAGIILVDRNDPDHATACGRIKTISNPSNPSASQVLTVDFGPNAYAATGSPDVVAIPGIRYALVPGASGGPNQLFRNAQLLTNDVEDLQVVYYFDANDDRIVDANEIVGDAATGTYPPLAGVDRAQLVELRIHVITVTRDSDPNQQAPALLTPAMANRTAASLAAGADSRRRRLHSTTVRLRNAG